MKTANKTSIGTDILKLTSSKFITMLISMLTAMLLSRFRTLDEYGTYSQILIVINLTTSLFMLGLPSSINYFLARSETEHEKANFLSVYYSISTVLSVVIGLVLVLGIPIIVKIFDNSILKEFYYVFALYPWSRVISSSIESILIVYKKTSLLFKYRILNSISLLMTIFIAKILNWNFNQYMFMFILIESLFAIYVYLIVKKIASDVKVQFDKKIIVDIFKFSIPIGLASVIGTLNVELDKLIIGSFMDTVSLAVYTNASRELPVTIIATSIIAILLPQVTKLLKEEKNIIAINLWGNATILSYIVICHIAFLFFSFAPEIITVLYSSKYLAGVSVFRVYNIVLLFRTTYFGMILNAKGKTKYILYSSIAALFLNVIFNFFFYRYLGFIGPAFATLVATFIIMMGQLIASSKIINVKLRNILPWKEIGIITLINVTGCMFILFSSLILKKYNFSNYNFILIFIGVIWSVLYSHLFRKKAIIQWKMLH